MTVGELIKQLKKQPKDSRVFTYHLGNGVTSEVSSMFTDIIKPGDYKQGILVDEAGFATILAID